MMTPQLHALALVFSGFFLLASAAVQAPCSLLEPEGSSWQPAKTLEARVASAPEDATALHSLVESYLKQGAPGLAVAVLERNPGASDSMKFADVTTLAYMQVGRPDAALELAQRWASSCARTGSACSAQEARKALWRTAVLQAMLQPSDSGKASAQQAEELAERSMIRRVSIAM